MVHIPLVANQKARQSNKIITDTLNLFNATEDALTNVDEMLSIENEKLTMLRKTYLAAVEEYNKKHKEILKLNQLVTNNLLEQQEIISNAFEQLGITEIIRLTKNSKFTYIGGFLIEPQMHTHLTLYANYKRSVKVDDDYYIEALDGLRVTGKFSKEELQRYFCVELTEEQIEALKELRAAFKEQEELSIKSM